MFAGRHKQRLGMARAKKRGSDGHVPQATLGVSLFRGHNLS